MKKIPSVFQYDSPNRGRVINKVTPGCEWVLAGEGWPTEKYDGTACMIDPDGGFWKRREVRKGNPSPDDFFPAGPPDPVTGKRAGWVPVGQGPEDKWHLEGYDQLHIDGAIFSFTFELVGPKIQNNPYQLEKHELRLHGDPCIDLEHIPRTYSSIKGVLKASKIEGIVYHHIDGRMAKVRRNQLGLEWPIKQDDD